MILKKISEKEFEELQYNWKKNYFANGAVWDNETDNLVAFPKYTYVNDEEIEEFYKIIETTETENITITITAENWKKMAELYGEKRTKETREAIIFLTMGKKSIDE